MYHTKPNSFTLLFAENPCKVIFQSPINLNEFDEAVFNCSTSSLCGTRPVIEGLPVLTHAQYRGSTSTSTVARLKVDWTYHQQELSCDVPGVINECLRQHITLTVQCKP